MNSGAARRSSTRPKPGEIFLVRLNCVDVPLCLLSKIRLELMAFLVMVNDLGGLFEADGDEDAEDDDAEVDEEIAACHGAVLWWVDVDHGRGFCNRDCWGLLSGDLRKRSGGRGF